MEKTNAIRIVEQNKIKYLTHEYHHEDGVCVDGETVASLLGQNPLAVFKTIVLTNSNKYYVCVIPVVFEIDLKKAAKAFGLKSLEMLPVKELFNLTGYIRGGCSPIGMKKKLPTIVDIEALKHETIMFSGGKIGLQLEITPDDLKKLTNCSFSDIRKVNLC